MGLTGFSPGADKVLVLLKVILWREFINQRNANGKEMCRNKGGWHWIFRPKPVNWKQIKRSVKHYD